MENLNNQTILLAIVAVTALALLLQAAVLLAIFLSVRKTARTLKTQADEFRSSVIPILDRTRELIARVSPHVEATVTDVAAMTHGLRQQTEKVEATAQDILESLRQQSKRLDTMLSTVLDAVDRACGFLTVAVSKPARKLSGLLAFVKAIIVSLSSSGAAGRPPSSPGNEGRTV
jgi:uncharacterized protein YoxC